MSKGKKIIGFIVVLLVIGGATFAGVYFTSMKGGDTAKVVVIEEITSDVGEVFVNLSDADAKRYVKLKLSIGFDEKNKELTAEVEKKHAVIRDVVIHYFESCTVENLQAANEEALKSELIKRLNQKLTKGVILNVYITEKIVQ
ncbi:flagellar basal body-associated FliL family protein [Clostridium gasigenes]|uniref:Flagellar protein FliL n=1 Tax=Clostridium gasigenes TaxID=94869 RepID=A0A7X0SBQ4_9CLOT|nr:flagellar basal body-associated FliL family protein [Clostridium gasigenes]MBB6714627.1 flagellar basal body-associated FliL family protein [Clostridium gasigenes]